MTNDAQWKTKCWIDERNGSHSHPLSEESGVARIRQGQGRCTYRHNREILAFLCNSPSANKSAKRTRTGWRT
ncbi:MAG: hypothetical protein ACQEU4_05500 [Bacillota bacterium]